MTARRFPFAFAPSYRPAAAVFGILPATSYVEVGATGLRVRFGPWSLRTSIDNIVEMTETGGYAYLMTAGPAHLSFADHGVTFATNGDAGLCLRFRDPVPAIAPFGLLPHPGATVTVSDRVGLRHAIEAAATR